MMDLFLDPATLKPPAIEGLIYIPNYIAVQEEQRLINYIDQSQWDTRLQRRVQHYGYLYDYRSRSLDQNAYIGPLPDWLEEFGKRLYQLGIFNALPDQVIINEYQPGQGISPHIDCEPCFGDTIASLSLLSGATMVLNDKNNEKKEDIYLQERSLIALSNTARYQWLHGIPAKKIGHYKRSKGNALKTSIFNVQNGY